MIVASPPELQFLLLVFFTLFILWFGCPVSLFVQLFDEIVRSIHRFLVAPYVFQDPLRHLMTGRTSLPWFETRGSSNGTSPNVAARIWQCVRGRRESSCVQRILRTLASVFAQGSFQCRPIFSLVQALYTTTQSSPVCLPRGPSVECEATIAGNRLIEAFPVRVSEKY